MLKTRFFAAMTLFAAATFLPAQTPAPAPADPAAPAAPAAPMPPASPAMVGPLADLPSATLDAGPFGKISVNGFISGMGLAQSNHIPGDDSRHADLSNGQIVLQKTDGWFQWYLQAGAYNLPSLGTPFFGTNDTLSNFFGPVPQAYIKLQAGKNTSFEIGALPTLLGAEYTYTFENMNINRGLLWNQENAVNRGIQVNQTMGKFTASFSWNDGFYSDRYSWLWGSLAYANGPHALSFVAGGNLSQTAFQVLATPVQNNGSIYNVIYTYTKGSWILQPYWQYSNIPTNAKIGITKGATTNSFALLASHTFGKGFSLPLRFEYISSSGNTKDSSVNLLYGPGSSGTSFTVTPTYQTGGFFARGDVAVVHIGSLTPGFGFGQAGNDATQFRVTGEIGFIFGDNLKK